MRGGRILLPTRKKGLRWRATRAPQWVAIQLGREKISLPFLRAQLAVSRAALCIPVIAALMGTTKRSVEGVRILDLLGHQKLKYSRQNSFLRLLWRKLSPRIMRSWTGWIRRTRVALEGRGDRSSSRGCGKVGRTLLSTFPQPAAGFFATLSERTNRIGLLFW